MMVRVQLPAPLRGGSSIRRVYDATADRVRTDWRVAACPLTGSCALWAVRTAVTVGGVCRRHRVRAPRGRYGQGRW